MADVLQHAFFGGERNRTHWIRGLTKRQLTDLMQGKATKEEKMPGYEGFTNHDEKVMERGRIEGVERGVTKGRIEGGTDRMTSLMAKRFGKHVAGAALPFIAGVSDPAALDRVESLFLDNEDGEEFLGRLTEAGPANGRAG